MKKIHVTLAVSFILCISYANAQLKKNLDKEPQQAIKLNFLSPFWGTVNLSYQKLLDNETSFQLTTSYMDFDSYGSTGNDYYQSDYQQTTTGNNTITTYTNKQIRSQRTQGIAITPEYRYMINGRGLSGIYIAPFARYMYYKHTRDLEVTTTTTVSNNLTWNSTSTFTQTGGVESYFYHTVSLGIIAGKQFIYKNKVAIDLFAGPSYSILAHSNITVKRNSDIEIGTGIPNLYLRGYGARAGILIGLVY